VCQPEINEYDDDEIFVASLTIVAPNMTLVAPKNHNYQQRCPAQDSLRET